MDVKVITWDNALILTKPLGVKFILLPSITAIKSYQEADFILGVFGEDCLSGVATSSAAAKYKGAFLGTRRVAFVLVFLWFVSLYKQRNEQT